VSPLLSATPKATSKGDESIEKQLMRAREEGYQRGWNAGKIIGLKEGAVKGKMVGRLAGSGDAWRAGQKVGFAKGWKEGLQRSADEAKEVFQDGNA
jgi:flagellar biosynthesis/type III secretory pathway protein FliH